MNAKWFVPQTMYQKDPAAFETREELRFRVSSISDEYLAPDIVAPQSASQVPSGPMITEFPSIIEQEIETDMYKKYFVTGDRPQRVTANTMMFPGWQYWVNGETVSAVRQNGLPGIMVPSGRSAVELRFTNTWSRTIGNTVSLVTVIALLYLYGKQTRKTHA